MLEINNTTCQKINLTKTKKIVDAWLLVYKKSDWFVSLALIGAKRMRKLNKCYRGIDKATDVLSFPGDSKGKFLGEVIINLEEIKKPNKYLEVFGVKKRSDYIFNFLLVHGLLHLIGYNDESEKERQKMISLGEKFLAKFY